MGVEYRCGGWLLIRWRGRVGGEWMKSCCGVDLVDDDVWGWTWWSCESCWCVNGGWL